VHYRLVHGDELIICLARARLGGGGRCGISRLGTHPSSPSSVAARVSSTSLWVLAPTRALSCAVLACHLQVAARPRASLLSPVLWKRLVIFCSWSEAANLLPASCLRAACCMLPVACLRCLVACSRSASRAPGALQPCPCCSRPCCSGRQRPCSPNTGMLRAASRTGLMAAVLDNSTTRVYRCLPAPRRAHADRGACGAGLWAQASPFQPRAAWRAPSAEF
jgi:hypothetical protein